MRLLWIGDAVVATGFSRCTHTVCDHLHDSDWDVHVLGLNYYGDPHPYPYSIYPCYQPLDHGRDIHGISRFSVLAERLNPDIIVILNDPWNIPSYIDTYDSYVDTIRTKDPDRIHVAERMVQTPIVAWLAVDGNNQKASHLNRLSHVVTWTQHAADQLAQGGYHGSISIVPLGVDSHFTPYDRDESRRELFTNFPDGAFLFGVVGRNQPRKRLDLTLEYFAEFLRRTNTTDTYLYLHVAPTGEMGFDLRSLANYHSLHGRVFLHEVRADKGISESLMPKAYSAMDVLITTTQGEGWGLPVLEAGACGTPSIVPDWSALGEWPNEGVIKIPCTATAVTAPLNKNPYTIGGIPDKELFVRAMIDLYANREALSAASKRVLEMPKIYNWRNTAVQMETILRQEVEKTRGTPIQADSNE